MKYNLEFPAWFISFSPSTVPAAYNQPLIRLRPSGSLTPRCRLNPGGASRCKSKRVYPAHLSGSFSESQLAQSEKG